MSDMSSLCYDVLFKLENINSNRLAQTFSNGNQSLKEVAMYLEFSVYYEVMVVLCLHVVTIPTKQVMKDLMLNTFFQS